MMEDEFWAPRAKRSLPVLLDNTKKPPNKTIHLTEIFYTLKEAKMLIEKWRVEYNIFRPHSSLNYRPPAPAYLN